jgi:hypothetical protein
MQKVFRSSWKDLNDGSTWSLQLFPNTYDYGAAGDPEYVDLPPNVFVINEIQLAKYSTYHRVGLSEVSTLKLNVDFAIATRGGGLGLYLSDDFLNTLISKPVDLPVQNIGLSINVSDNLFPVALLKRHNYIRITKTPSIFNKEMSGMEFEFHGIQTDFITKLEIGKYDFDITFDEIVGYALSNVSFKIAWRHACLFSNNYYPEEQPNDFRFPFAHIYHNEKLDDYYSYNGIGKNNVAGSLVYVPIDKAKLNEHPGNLFHTLKRGTKIKWGNATYEDVSGWTIYDVNKACIAFRKLDAIFSSIAEKVNNFINILGGESAPRFEFQPTQAIYYKQKYDNSGEISGSGMDLGSLYIPIAIIDTAEKIVFMYNDNSRGDIFSKLDYKSVQDFLQDLYLADGTYCGPGGENFPMENILYIDGKNCDITLELNSNEFENIRGCNVEFYDADIQNKEIRNGGVGTSDGVNITNIFHTQSTNNVARGGGNNQQAMVQYTDIYGDMGLGTKINFGRAGCKQEENAPAYKGKAGSKINNLWITNNVGREMRLQLFYIEDEADWLFNSSTKVPVACHHFVKYPHIKGWDWADFKQKNPDAGKMDWGKYKMGKQQISIDNKQDADNLDLIISSLKRIQDVGCSHTFSAHAISKTFSKSSRKMTIKVALNDIVKKNSYRFHMNRLFFHYINFDFNNKYFHHINGNYFVVNAKWDVGSGDLELDLINEGDAI